MKVAEILRQVADILDQAEQQAAPKQVEIPLFAAPEEETESAPATLGATTRPRELVYPQSAAYPSGTDLQHAKNPADIRADSISMYPNYSAQPRK